MSRYKGRPSLKAIERDFPNIVEMAVPVGGFCRKIDEFEAWRRERGIDSRSGPGDYRDGVWYVRNCFLSRDDAEAFVSRFGGQLLEPAGSSTAQRARTGRR